MNPKCTLSPFLAVKAALRADSVAELEIVKERKRARAWFTEDGPAWLKKYLHGESLEGTDVVRISFSYGSPKDQVAVINAVAKAYHDLVIQRQRKRLREDISEGRKTLAEKRRELDSLEKQLAALNDHKGKDDNEARNLARQRTGLAHLMAHKREQIKEIEASIRFGENRLQNMSVFFLEPAEVPDSP
jgi:uncharacterized protein involved in exopolysaccharide biosynthesis